MPRFNISRARKFLRAALDAPLFEHIGQPFEAVGVIRAKTLAQFCNAMKSSTLAKVSNNCTNYHATLIIDTYGWDWFQKRHNDNVASIWEAIDDTDFRKKMNAAWKGLGLPDEIHPFINPKTWAYNYMTSIAYDHALGFSPDVSYSRRYLEPWLLSGHLPCGWKGTAPSEPKETPNKRGWTDVPLSHVIGNCKLIVY